MKYQRNSLLAVVLGAIVIVSSPFAGAMAGMGLDGMGGSGLNAMISGLVIFVIQVLMGCAMIRVGWRQVPDPESLNKILNTLRA